MGVDDRSRRLKIAIVMDRYLPSRGGESYFSWLAKELSRRGHEVHIFAAAVEAIGTTEYQLHRVPTVAYPPSMRILSFLLNSTRAVRPYAFDIVHGVGRCLAMNVFNPHGGVEKAYLTQEFSSITNRLYYGYRFLRRYLFLQHYLKVWIQRKQYLSDRVKKIIAISQMVKDDIIRYYGVSEEKIAVVFNSTDLNRFHPKNRTAFRSAKRAELGIAEETLVLVFAGNNYRLKGLYCLLHALATLRQRVPDQPLCLLVAGRGQIGRFRKMARRLGVGDLTRFLGPVRKMEQVYAMGDIYVHPTFYDSCSLTVLEALATGLPVITSRFNGAAEAIRSDQMGKVLEDPTDVEGLAESIASFFDENRRDVAQSFARREIERYSFTYNVEETLRVYYEVVDGA
jgi:UDP-glucose:(heptosyl)LPS alpha-1,3-glucosyltransferase